MGTTITTGDDVVILHTLKKNGNTFNINSNAVVTCRLITPSHIAMTDEVVQSSTSPEADWSNSLISVNIPSSVTTDLLNDNYVWSNGTLAAKLETQVDDGGKLTWFENITIVKGTIL